MSPHLCFQSEDGAAELRHLLVFGVFLDLQILHLSLRQPQLLSQLFGVLSMLLQVLLNTKHTQFRALLLYTTCVSRCLDHCTK